MITVTITEQTDPVGKPFPKLMINTPGNVILARSSTEYTVLKHTSAGQVGQSYQDVTLAGFVDYVGPITLENAE